jgi:hypothetical protein
VELSLKRTTEIAAGLAGIALQIFFWWPSLGKIAAGHNDFLTLYAGGRLVGSGQLYDAARNAQVELATGGATGRVLRYIRPPFQAVMFRPLAALPFLLAYRIYVLLSLFALVGFVLLWPGPDRAALALACCWSLPVSAVFANGQDVAFLLLWLALAARWHDRRPVWAGMALALCAAKFQLFLLIPLWLLAQRRWRMLSGLAAGGGILTAISFLFEGWTWPQRMLAAVRSPLIGPGEWIMPNLHGLWLGRSSHPVVEGASVLAVTAVVALIAMWRSQFTPGLCAALVGSLLISYHAYPADAALLIPALLATFHLARMRWLRLLALALLAPIWYWFLMSGGPLGSALRLGMLAVLTGIAWEAWRFRRAGRAVLCDENL